MEAGYFAGKYIGNKSLIYQPEISPSGKYVFERMIGYSNSSYMRFSIKPADYESSLTYTPFLYMWGWILFKSYNHYSLGENDTLWVYSGDVGAYYWEVQDEVWERKSADDKSIELAPDEIEDKWK